LGEDEINGTDRNEDGADTQKALKSTHFDPSNLGLDNIINEDYEEQPGTQGHKEYSFRSKN